MSANKKAKLNPTIFAKKLDRLLERTTDQNIQIIEYRSPNTLKILLNSGATFLDAPRTDPSKQTARKQLQWMQCQPVKCLVEYKSKVHKGMPYGRRYAESEFYPPMQCMKREVRAAMSIGQVDVDMKCAHPTFICDILMEECPKAITDYVDHRDDMLNECMAATGLSRDLVKPLFNVPLYSADDWKLSW